jgi:hypothetical protein
MDVDAHGYHIKYIVQANIFEELVKVYAPETNFDVISIYHIIIQDKLRLLYVHNSKYMHLYI